MNKRILPTLLEDFVNGITTYTKIITALLELSDMPAEQRQEALQLHHENEAQLLVGLNNLKTASETDYDQRVWEMRTSLLQHFDHIKAMLNEAIGTIRLISPEILQQLHTSIGGMTEKLDQILPPTKE